MTIGTVNSGFPASGIATTTYADGTPTLYGSTYFFGQKYYKTWSGTDYPVQKPVYEYFSFVSSKGKLLKGRRRVDVPTRRKTVDHDYSCSIDWRRQSEVTKTADRAYFEYSTGSAVLKWTSDYTQVDGYGNGWSFEVISQWTTNDDIALLGKLREAVAGSDFNMGVFLGEGREALRMITDSATRIYRALRAVKRGRVLLAMEHLGVKDIKRRRVPTKDTAAQNWLALQYGWLPLVKDAQGAAQFLAKHLEFPFVKSYKVRRTRKAIVIDGAPLTVGNFGYGHNRKQIIARLTESNTTQLLGLTDPASVAWELVPFSFVVDWFIPIGNYLAARSLASALTGSFVTTTSSYEFCGYGSPQDYYATMNRHTWSASTNTWKKISVSRVNSTGINVPVPSFKTLGEVPSWKRAANAVSLLVLLGPKMLSKG